MKPKKKGKRGGRQPGAGRPALYGEKMVKCTIWLPRNFISYLTESYSNPAKGVRILIERDMSHANTTI